MGSQFFSFVFHVLDHFFVLQSFNFVETLVHINILAYFFKFEGTAGDISWSEAVIGRSWFAMNLTQFYRVLDWYYSRDVWELRWAIVRLIVSANFCYLLGLKFIDWTISALLSVRLKLQQAYMFELLSRDFRTLPKSSKHIAQLLLLLI